MRQAIQGGGKIPLTTTVDGSDAGLVVIGEAQRGVTNFKNYALLTTLEPVAAFNTSTISKIGLNITVEDDTLDQFEVHVQYEDGGDWINLSLANGDFTTPNYPVIKSNITNIAAIIVGISTLELDVSAYHRIMIKAASSAATFSKVQISTGNVKPLSRRVTNEFPYHWNMVSESAVTELGGTATYDDDSGEIAFSSGSLGRVYLIHSLTTVVGEYYALSFDCVSLSGTPSNSVLAIFGAGFAKDEGVSFTSTVAAGTRAMIVCRASAAVTTTARIGVGCDADDTDVVMVAKNFMVQRLGSNLTNIGEYVPCGFTQSFNDNNSGSWNPTAMTFINDNKGGFNGEDFYNLNVIGDSFANDLADFPQEVTLSLGNTKVSSYAVGSIRFDQIADNIDDYFINGLPVNNLAYNGKNVEFNLPTNSIPPRYCLIQGGVNDIAVLGTSTNNPIPLMQASFKTIEAKVREQGMLPMAMNVCPFGNSAQFDLADQHNMYVTSWNGWLKDYCKAKSIPYIDAHAATVDPADPLALVAAADSGDGLHLSAAGAKTVGDLIVLELMRNV